MKKLKSPNYKKIYEDILNLRYPEKKNNCMSILSKAHWTANDIIQIDNLIFPKKDHSIFAQNQKHRSYDRTSIIEILEYQKKNNLNDRQLASYFKLSRNTVAKWRKQFLV